MNRVLLDSHVVLWVLDDSPKLGSQTRSMLAIAEAYVSAASVWELHIKAERGQLELPEDFLELLAQAKLKQLPITWGQASALGEAAVLEHRDPFDRLLYVQAVVEKMPLVTADRRLLKAPRAVLDARL